MAKLEYEIEIKTEKTIYYYILLFLLKLKIEWLGWWFIHKYWNRVIINLSCGKPIKSITIGNFIEYTDENK